MYEIIVFQGVPRFSLEIAKKNLKERQQVSSHVDVNMFYMLCLRSTLVDFLSFTRSHFQILTVSNFDFCDMSMMV